MSPRPLVLRNNHNNHNNDNRTLDNVVVLRHFVDGQVAAHGRLCLVEIDDDQLAIDGEVVRRALLDDGVDLERFQPCAYEIERSGGGWLPLDDDDDDVNGGGRRLSFSIPPPITDDDDDDAEDARVRRRIDVKLFRRRIDDRPRHTVAAAFANAAATQVTGRLSNDHGGYFGIGVYAGRSSENTGTLWRSAWQLGAAFLYTVGRRYETSATDTVSAPGRVPLFEHRTWADFVAAAPNGARWVAVEMGGVPLEDYDHPRNAVYVLGSEDNGLPNAVLRACHDVVSLDSVNYASYNVAVAGTLVMYDRTAKEKRKRRREKEDSK